MLRIKIPVGNSKLEVEADTEAELEVAVRVALRAAGLLSSSSNSMPPIISPERQVDKRVNHAGSLSVTAVSGSSSLKVPPPGYKPPSYKKLPKNTNRERLRLALCDLILNFDRRQASAGEIITHLEATGSKFMLQAKDRGASARQTLRTDQFLESTGTGWRLTEEGILRYAPFVWKGADNEQVEGLEENRQELEGTEWQDKAADDQSSVGPLVLLPS